MKKNSLSATMQKLQLKQQQETEQIMELTSQNLNQFSKSLSEKLMKELSTTEKLIQDRSRKISKQFLAKLKSLQDQIDQFSKNMSRLWMKNLTILALLCLFSLGAGWGVTAYYQKNIQELMKEQKNLTQTIANLEKETWGLTLYESKSGRFIILPPQSKKGRTLIHDNREVLEIVRR